MGRGGSPTENFPDEHLRPRPCNVTTSTAAHQHLHDSSLHCSLTLTEPKLRSISSKINIWLQSESGKTLPPESFTGHGPGESETKTVLSGAVAAEPELSHHPQGRISARPLPSPGPNPRGPPSRSPLLLPQTKTFRVVSHGQILPVAHNNPISQRGSPGLPWRPPDSRANAAQVQTRFMTKDGQRIKHRTPV